MGCRTIMVGETHVIVCSRGNGARCDAAGCTAESVALCDYPLHGEKTGKTCDRRMCKRHRNPVAGKSDVDYCGVHFRLEKLVQR